MNELTERVLFSVTWAVWWTIWICVWMVCADVAVRGDMWTETLVVFSALAVFFYWRRWQR